MDNIICNSCDNDKKVYSSPNSDPCYECSLDPDKPNYNQKSLDKKLKTNEIRVRLDMDAYKEQLEKMIELCEKQVKTIKIMTGFTDAQLYPQLKALEEAKEVLNNESEVKLWKEEQKKCKLI